MKIILLVLVVGAVCIVLFAAGVFSPGRSKRMQESAGRLAAKGEAKGDRKPASSGTWRAML